MDERPTPPPPPPPPVVPIVVLKVGTSSLVSPKGQVQVSSFARVAECVARLRRNGLHVVIVTSGAVGLGCVRLGLAARPPSVAGKQACAAVGQPALMSLYDDIFSVLGYRIAQVLLTYDAFGDRTQYLNARNTFLELLRLGAVPIVNENDTVATNEIRVGDNDTLSALVACMLSAQFLFLMTDVEALFDANPSEWPAAQPIRYVRPADVAMLRKQMQAGICPLVPGLTLEEAQLAAVRAGIAALGGAGGGGGGRGVGGAPAGGSEGSGASSGGSSGGGGRTRSVSPADAFAAAGLALTRHQRKAAAADSATEAAHVNASVPAPASAVAAAFAPPTLPARALTGSGNMGGAGSAFGTGGMVTKLKAAQLATAAGVAVVIMSTARIEVLDATLASAAAAAIAAVGSGAAPPPLAMAFADRAIGTTFLPQARPDLPSRKRWILSLKPEGALVLDAGAAEAVSGAVRKSLFAVGVVAVEGDFEAQDAVAVLTEGRVEVARALVNYSSEDCRRMRGRRSRHLEAGEAGSEEAAIAAAAAAAAGLPLGGAEALCDRDNVVVMLAR